MSIRMPSRNTPDAGARARRRVIGLALVLAAVAAHAEPPELLADFGGGNTELREADVDVPLIIGGPIRKQIELGPGSADLMNMRVRYKIYSLLGEAVVDALLYWERWDTLPSQGLHYVIDGSEYIDDLSFEHDRLKYGDVDMSPGSSFNAGGAQVTGSQLREYPDLYDRYRDVAPLDVNLRARIESTNADGQTRIAYIGFDVDLPNTSGRWQRLSVPSAPELEELARAGGRTSDAEDIREVFRNRGPGEDVRITDVRLYSIQWPDATIRSIIAEYYRREIRRMEREEADEQSDDDFWGTQDAGLNPEDVERGRPTASAPVRERHRPDRSDNQRYERFAAMDPEAILDIEVYPDKGQRFITINRDPSLDGMELEKRNVRGAVAERIRLGQTYSFELEGAMGSLVFSRNGEVIAEYDKLRDPGYTTVEISDELTDVEVDSRRITIRVNDNEEVDGDRIDLFVNGARVLSDHYLSGGGTSREITLQRGPNIVQIVSTDDGDSAPNTSQLTLSNVVSGSSVQQWQLYRGESATLQIRAPVR